MMLKVGELAKRTGVTVRALHHYDSIGLLRPSGRSEAGYRLYNRDDVARLHGIQALRQLGVALADVARLLDAGTSSLPSVIARQISSLDQQISHSQALRKRLIAMQAVLASGRWPEMEDWLSSLSNLATYRQYFSAEELQRALERWKPQEAEWPPLVQAIRAAMDRGVPPDAVEVQPLLAQWIVLVSRWMEGDLDFLGRWGSMLRQHPELPLPAGMDLELLDYLDDAIRRRLAVVARYVTPEQQQRLTDTRPDWHDVVERGKRLMADHVPPDAPAARELARDWSELWHRTVGGDTALRERLIAAYETEPLLQAGLAVTPALRDYIAQASGP